MGQASAHGDAFAGAEANLASGLDNDPCSVAFDGDLVVCEIARFIRVLRFDDQIAATTDDDVFHLDPVKVHRGFLPFADDQKLFGVRALVRASLYAIPEAEKDQAALLESPRAEVSDIPTHLVCAAEGGYVRVRLPIRRRPMTPGRNREPVFGDKRLGFRDELI